MKKRLLVIDDDIDILEALTLVLDDSYEVVSTTDGVDALRQLQRKHFDIAVIDLMMPEMDGETLVESIRQIGIKVPLLLASAVPDLAGRAARLGLPAIAKPYAIPMLEAKLAEVLRAAG